MRRHGGCNGWQGGCWRSGRRRPHTADVRTAEVAAVMGVTGGTVAQAVEKAVAETEHRLREALTALREAASECETMEVS